VPIHPGEAGAPVDAIQVGSITHAVRAIHVDPVSTTHSSHAMQIHAVLAIERLYRGCRVRAVASVLAAHLWSKDTSTDEMCGEKSRANKRE